ncbi:hypothetical protein A9Z42_0046340 [Trichoderma parareesei]|uniref:Uncharacterized protein n=1 Tax=Trichoderma parareesei TaxID=858221 RepID=A0A2H2ZJA0_TRIPA|nr:hypothetical protein A9Z42_0046340 [Trichoderma parareesei]
MSNSALTSLWIMSLSLPPSVIICRLTKDPDDANPCHVINVIRDDDDEAASCCCTWTMDAGTGRPSICIGGVDAKVKIYDAISGDLIEDVNDLATSPVNPHIIASASDDTSVRIWSVEEKHRRQPCLCILAGEGHSWNLLSVAFHETGNYLLSGGHDQIINLWTVPDLPTEPIDTPLQVHYPHFSTSAVHSGIVDCVSFFGDLILSRACHDNVIVLWKIEGFSSDGPPPSQSAAPTPQNVLPTNYEDPGRLTRSAFVPVTSPQCPVQYTRLLAFNTPNCGPQFFMRFRLHHVPNQNPVLAFCNAAGNIFFWDLKRLTAHRDIMLTLSNPADKDKPVQLPSWQKTVIPRSRADSTNKSRAAASQGQAPSAPGTVKQADSREFSPETLESWATKYSMADTHEPLRHHKMEASSANFVGRQASWSPGGDWCVVVGSSNTALLLHRWAQK